MGGVNRVLVLLSLAVAAGCGDDGGTGDATGSTDAAETTGTGTGESDTGGTTDDGGTGTAGTTGTGGTTGAADGGGDCPEGNVTDGMDTGGATAGGPEPFDEGCGNVMDEPMDPPGPMAGMQGMLPTLEGRYGPTDGGVYRLPDRYTESRAWPMMVGITGYGYDGADTLGAWIQDPFVREWIIVVGLSAGDGVHAQNEYGQMQEAGEYMEHSFSVDTSNVWAFGTEAGQFAATYAGLQYKNLDSTPQPTYQYRGIVTYGGHDGGDFTTYPGMIDHMNEQADKLAWQWIISENDPPEWSVTVTDRWYPSMLQQFEWKHLRLSIMPGEALVYRLQTLEEVREAVLFFCAVAEADRQGC